MSGGGYFHSGDNINAVVADIGSYATKIGFAGEDFPKAYFRSNTAVKQNNDGSGLTIKYDYFSRPLENDADYQVANPVDDGTGLWYGENDQWYHLVEKYLQHGYESSLNSRLTHHPLLLIERSYNPPPLRQAVLELCMEELQVPAMFLGRDATMACYACGRTTGTVVDVGYSGTTVTPVHEGYVESKGIRRLPVGTRHMDQMIVQNLDTLLKAPFAPLYRVQKYKMRSPDIHELTRLHVAQQCREEGSGAAVLAVSDPGFTAPSKPFELPDGTVIDVPAKQRFQVPDIVFGQNDEGIREAELAKVNKLLAARIQQADALDVDNDEDKDFYEQQYSESASVGLLKRRQDASKKVTPFSTTWKHLQKACSPFLQSLQHDHITASHIPAMICEAAFACDRDQQAQLLANVVLAGGGACLGPTESALPDFVRENTETIIHQHTPGWRVKVLSPSMPERSVCSWLGGSILGSLGTFHDMWITKKEYEEWGSAIVNRKCP